MSMEARRDGSCRLPDPIWQHIISYVDAQSLYSVMLLSRHFRALCVGFQPFFQHWRLRAAEDMHVVRPYISKQRHLNAKMRAILLDWITDVHQSLSFRPSTLYRAGQILDTFLIKTENVSREKLQLVGVTSFMVAAKGFEAAPPDPDDCAYWTDNAYSGPEVSAMEARIRRVWKSDRCLPTILDFLLLYLQKAGLGKLASCRAHYYAERVIQEHGMLAHKPSVIAAAAVLMALKAGMPSEPAWPKELADFTRYSEEELMPVVASM